jgi:hypothetical protein
MEFSGEVPSASTLESLFRKLGLKALFVGQAPPTGSLLKKTQRIY